MNELLQKLLESEVFTDDSKKQIAEAFEASLNEAIEQAKQETEIKVRAELTEQFVTEKEALVEAIDSKVEQWIAAHKEELDESVSDFRDLEAEYATRLVEARKEIAETVKADMAELVNQLDAFTTKCLEEEFAELEASIEEVKKYQFGKEIFEAVQKTFENKFMDSNETLNQLREAQTELEAKEKSLAEATKALATVKRDQKLNEVLEPLNGLSREIMETILKTTPTEKLEETYEKFIGRVLHDASTKSEKESAKAPVLAESEEKKLVNEETKVVSGDTEVKEVNEAEVKTGGNLSEATLLRIRKLAGND